MKLTAAFALAAFQSTITLIAHLSNKTTLLEAGVISAVCIMAYAVGESVIRKDFQKDDVKKGTLIGIFAGILSQILVYYMPEKSAYITIVLVVFCMFPVQITDIALKLINRKSDKL